MRTGEGSPTVVIVAAIGGSASDWNQVQEQLTPTTNLCTYDRAGLGWSHPAPGLRTASVIADELHDLLTVAAVPPPYVLVGHSLGGYVARLYAARHRELVAGMVLVDSSHEEQGDRHPELAWRSQRVRAAGLRLRHPLSRKWRTTIREMADFAGSAAEVRAECGHLGALPLTVVTALARPNYDGVWPAMQRELAALSECSTHLLAERSGHYVHRDEPDVVVDAVRRHVRP